MATATIRDVAREAGVSIASASRALNNHQNVTAKMRERVVDAARKLDYVPHIGARSLTRQRTDTIGVVLPELFGEFFSEVIRGIDSAAHRAGRQLLLANMHGSASETAAAIRAMRGRVDGLLVMSPMIDPEFLSQHLPAALPSVVLNGHIGGVGHGSLSIDNHAGAAAMVRHLAACGYRRIAHISGPQNNNDAVERLAGFRQACLDVLGDGSPLIFEGDFSEEAGRAAAGRIIGHEVAPDAVFAANDMMAVGCMTMLAEAGVDVPGRIGIAGFDDIPIARYVSPRLTTMQVHIAEVGTRALDMLLGIIAAPTDTPQHITLMPELVARQSTRPAAG